jgi:transposase
LDPFKEEIYVLLRRDPRLPGVRVRELIEPSGFVGGKTIVDDYLREVRPLFLRPRTFQRTVYRPGGVCQFDLWHTTGEVPVGHGQTRQGYVVVAALGYSSAGAGPLVFSRQAPDVLCGMAHCLWSLGGIPQLLVWDREGACGPATGARPIVSPRFCGQLKTGWRFFEPSDPQAKGVVERLQG